MRIKETFVYTNAVPQFGRLNSGHWRVFEENLLTWAEKNCKGAPLHIIVGTIPSTYWPNDWRFFGEAGFSDFVGSSKILTGKSPYRVNVPAYMWTAACCHSESRKLTKSTAFFAPNSPGFGLVRGVGVSDLFLAIRVAPADISAVDLFPQLDDCNKAENYIKI
jgi:DNA/RNA endonuclease G (NUC1)